MIVESLLFTKRIKKRVEMEWLFEECNNAGLCGKSWEMG